jgi:hypothetical protein
MLTRRRHEVVRIGLLKVAVRLPSQGGEIVGPKRGQRFRTAEWFKPARHEATDGVCGGLSITGDCQNGHSRSLKCPHPRCRVFFERLPHAKINKTHESSDRAPWIMRRSGNAVFEFFRD